MRGTIDGRVTLNDNKFIFYIDWVSIPNIEGNYSDVTVKSYWAPQSGWETWDFDTTGERSASITINGNTSSISKVFYTGDNWSNGNPYLIQSYTHKVYHNNDGTKSIEISARANGRASEYGPSASMSSSDDCVASGTIKLDTIPRSSKITSTKDIVLGEECEIKWVPASSNFKYKVEFLLGDWYYVTDYISPESTDTYTYKRVIQGNEELNNTTLYQELSASPSGKITTILTTYNSNNEQIGSSDASAFFYVMVPDDVVPTVGDIELSAIITTALDEVERDILVQDRNKIKISVSGCSAGISSTIKSYTFDVLNGPVIIDSKKIDSNSGEASVEFGPFTQFGNFTFKVTVLDTRERFASKDVERKCYEYNDPKFDSFDIYRADEKKERDMNGTWLMCKYVVDCQSVNGTNDFSVVANYNGNLSVATNNGEIYLDLGNDDVTYKVYLEVTDNYGGNDLTSTMTIFGKSRILNITSDGTGIALGKMAEKNELFECRWPAKFDDELNCVAITTDSINTEAISANSIDCATQLNSDEVIANNISTDNISCSDIIINQQIIDENNQVIVNKTKLFDLIYPVGSIYMSVNDVNPSNIFGGTWEQIKDTFLLSSGDIYIAGNSGGEAEHILTDEEMPEHGPHLCDYPIGYGTANQLYLSGLSYAGSQYGTDGRGWNVYNGNEYYPAGQNLGGGKAHNNMPPYLVVYVWKRTAL